MGYRLSEKWADQRLREVFKLDGVTPDGVNLNYEKGTFTRNCRQELLQFELPSAMVHISDVQIVRQAPMPTSTTVQYNEIVKCCTESVAKPKITYKSGRVVKWMKSQMSAFSQGLSFEIPVKLPGVSAEIGSSILMTAGMEFQNGEDLSAQRCTESGIVVVQHSYKGVILISREVDINEPDPSEDELLKLNNVMK